MDLCTSKQCNEIQDMVRNLEISSNKPSLTNILVVAESSREE